MGDQWGVTPRGSYVCFVALFLNTLSEAQSERTQDLRALT
jgi:hypothetical protein